MLDHPALHEIDRLRRRLEWDLLGAVVLVVGGAVMIAAATLL